MPFQLVGPGPGYFGGSSIVDQAQQQMFLRAQQEAAARERAQQQAQQAALQQQQSADQFAQNLQLQRERLGSQEQSAHNADVRGAYFQQVSDVRRAEIQRQQGEQQVDQQGRLNQIQLGQAEQMRLQRLRQARSSVQANQDLSPQEQNMLITQIETGLNPLENRVRETQMLQHSIQSQAQAQQTQQQATLFNQHQEWLGRGIQGQLQSIEDPNNPGYRGLFHVDAHGRIQQLDFTQQNQLHEMRLTQGGLGIARGVQEMQQSGQMFPTELEFQRQRLLSAQQAYAHSGQAFPVEQQLQLQRLQSARQMFEQSGQQFPLQQRVLGAQAESAETNLQYLPEHLQQRRDMGTLQLRQLGNEVAAQPQNTALQQRHQELRNQMLQMEVSNNPDAIRLRREHDELTNRFLNGQVNRQDYEQGMRPITDQLQREHTRLQNQIISRELEGNLTPTQRRVELDNAVRRVDTRLRDMSDRDLSAIHGQGPTDETAEQRRARFARGREGLIQQEYRRALEMITPAPGNQGGNVPQGQPNPPAPPFDLNNRNAPLTPTQRTQVGGLGELETSVRDIAAASRDDGIGWDGARIQQNLANARATLARRGSLDAMTEQERQAYNTATLQAADFIRRHRQGGAAPAAPAPAERPPLFGAGQR